MCLLNVDYHTKQIKTGYKVVRKRYGFPSEFDEQGNIVSAGVYYPECQGACRRLPLNEWLDEKDYRGALMSSTDSTADKTMLLATRGRRYPCGFHTYVTEQAAKAWQQLATTKTALVKVKVRNCVASGYQRIGKFGHKHSYYRVVVAKQIKLVEVLP